jgi:Mg2+ and Co2+ transporter CorA
MLRAELGINTGTHNSTGIILLDPPFRLPPGSIYCEPAGHRSFNRRASLLDEGVDIIPPASNREALARHIHERFSQDPSLLESTKSDCFLLLGDVYRLVASNWIVINEYVNRELATIEYILEKEEPTFRDLEVYLKDLYIYRRRVTRYHELITQAKEQCTTRGQASWACDISSTIPLEHAKDMEADFIYLQDKVLATSRRIEKNIDLLTALVSIGEGKQALDENRTVGKLGLLATVFLPFSTVATIFSIQGGYGPGERMFWLFWTIAIPLTGVILVLSAFYYGIGISVVKKMARTLRFKKGSRESD